MCSTVGQVHAIRSFLLQVGITKFILAGRQMRTLGIQLGRSRIALRALQHQCQRVRLINVPGCSGCEADRQLVVATLVLIFCNVRALHASTKLIVQDIAVDMFADKERLRLGCRLRCKRFGALRGEVHIRNLDANHTFVDHPPWAVRSLGTQLPTFAFKHSANLTAFQFGVRVIGVA